MPFRKTRATGEEARPSDAGARKWRRAIGALTLSAALFAALPMATASAASDAPSKPVPSSIGTAAECDGSGGQCWEYYSWYWTYASCHETGREQVANNPGRYSDYNCQGGHGAVVWLWLWRK